MAGKNKPTQLELFSSLAKAHAPQKPKRAPLFEKIALNEKSIVFGICFLIVFIAAYVMGIEKGKKIQTADNNSNLAQIPRAAGSKKIKKEEKPKTINLGNQINEKKKRIKKELRNFKGYTVQVASFRNKTSAEKERVALEKKGYTAYIIPKNKFVIVCVGMFNNKDKAKLSQEKLKRLYDDCLIRKL